MIFQALFFNIFLLSAKVNKVQNRYLALFLLVQCFGIANHLCHIQWETGNFTTPHCLYIGRPFYLLYVPTFYLYVKSIVKNSIPNIKEAVHFIPFFALVLFLSITFYFKSANIKLEMLLSDNVIKQKHEIIISYITITLMLAYLIFSLRLLKIYRAKSRTVESDYNKMMLKWISTFIYFYIIGCILSALFTIDISYFSSIQPYMYFVMMVVFFLFYCFIFYNALCNPDIFNRIKFQVKYKTSSLSDSIINTYSKKLTDYIEEEKPYLNPMLRIGDLSNKLSISQWHLSQVINQSFGQTFFDFINAYRIREATKIFENKQGSDKTILEVIYAVGFNSKSSFNNAFKKHVGHTPSEYKKRLLL
jgi:AraC-like DNA-binding protein